MKYLTLNFLLVFGLFTACSSSNSAPAAAPATDGNAMEQAAAASGPIYEDLSAEEFAGRIGAPNTVILDVRTPAETAGGVIDGAIELNYRAPDFAEKVAALDKDKTYLVYCAAGGRSAKACEIMQDAGFKEVYNLKGGYGAWKE